MPDRLDHSELATSSSPDAAPQPSDAEVIRVLEEVRTASEGGQLPLGLLSRIRTGMLLVYGIVLFAVGGMVFWQQGTKGSRKSQNSGQVTSVDIKTRDQLLRAAGGDSAATEDLIANAQQLRGKLHWNSLSAAIDSGLNSRDIRARVAAVEVSLAVNNLEKNDASVDKLDSYLGDPQWRAWALWNLGALGQVGVQPEKSGKVIAAYLSDTDSNQRAAAVNALAVLATEETVPLLLDRFRNDPSPLVQERAACALAESGLYTRQLRLQAAGVMIGWLDDPGLSAQQRAWVQQALRDISGQQHGTDADAWREWYASAA
jgi:hypothetical protein